MKNISYILLRLYQIVLFFLTYLSFSLLLEFGEKINFHGGLIEKPVGFAYEIIHGTSATSGFNGASLGLGILTAVYSSLIVIIEIKLYDTKKLNR